MSNEKMSTEAGIAGSFLLACLDRPAVVAAVAGFIAEYEGNIIHVE